METANKLTFLSTKFFTENKREYRITVTISLDDDCHNNMCDWSITADIRWKNEYGIYKEYMGGCCHDEIAKHCPELAKFIPLHCCNHYGAPMYPVENGMYHIKNSDKSVAIEYLRISDKEYSKLSEAVDDKMYFKYLLFNLGIVDRWKHESGELIAELEDLCGKKWVNQYKPEEERFTLTLTDEERLLIEERIKAGYYSAENKNICFMSRGEYADPKIAYNGILMNYWDVYDCMDEVEEPTDDDWLNAVSNLFDSYTYDIKNTDVDKFKMSDVMNVYRIINL